MNIINNLQTQISYEIRHPDREEIVIEELKRFYAHYEVILGQYKQPIFVIGKPWLGTLNLINNRITKRFNKAQDTYEILAKEANK